LSGFLSYPVVSVDVTDGARAATTQSGRAPPARSGGFMLIDCEGCANRGEGCSGCLVAALFDEASPAAGLGAAEVQAIEVFARAGFDVEVLAAPARPGTARCRASRRVA
jgi:hypothetical protein